MTMLECITNAYGEFDLTRPIGPAAWPHFDLLFIHSGQVELVFEGDRSVELVGGQAVLIYPETHFEGKSLIEFSRASANHFRLAGAEKDLSSSMCQLIRKRKGWRVFCKALQTNVENDIDRLIKLSATPYSVFNAEMQSALMSLVLNQLFLSDTLRLPADQRWNELLQLLERNRDHAVSIEKMAKLLNLSPSRFQALFRQHFSTSPGKYFLEMRISEASRLLRETNTPIKQIAKKAGYVHVQHFYRAFQKQFHETPGEYRQKYSFF